MDISNITTDDDKIIPSNCTNNENNDNNIEVIVPLITIIPCGLSLISLIFIMVYTSVKSLFNKNKI